MTTVSDTCKDGQRAILELIHQRGELLRVYSYWLSGGRAKIFAGSIDSSQAAAWRAAKFFGKHYPPPEFALVFDSAVLCARKWP